MQTAKVSEAQSKQRKRAPMGGALVPSGLASVPIEPPYPKEVAEKLEFRTAAQYRKAIALAERYSTQAKLAVDRRAASIKKAERQAQVDHEETASNYRRQVTQARTRHRALLEQVHGKHRQALFQARSSASRTEEVYREVLRGLPGYGELVLRSLALQDARVVTHSLVSAYKGALGPDAMGDMNVFLYGIDRTLDLARDRGAIAPVRFADALVKAVLHRQIRRAGPDKEEIERLKQITGTRVQLMQSYLAEMREDAVPDVVRDVYQAVHDWLAQAAGTPFDVALDRLKLDVDATVRKEQKQLEGQIQLAAHQCNKLAQVRPVFDAYQEAQRVLISSEHAARGVLNGEVGRINAQLDKEIQLADAMVIGMDHTAAKRLTEAKRQHGEARKLVGLWRRELEDLEEVGGWQRFVWKMTEGFDYQAFWEHFHARRD
ncbi:MAG TPA: hypothetical protein V6D47_05505 [Oscillatoriaceae cyanobacterium]